MKVSKTFKVGRGLNRVWCGPYALARITGRTASYCAQLCAEVAHGYRGIKHTKNTIRGVSYVEMEETLKWMKFSARYPRTRETYRDSTLINWYNRMETEMWRATLLICVTNHYIVLHRGVVYDTCRKYGESADTHPARRRKIKRIWMIDRQ